MGSKVLRTLKAAVAFSLVFSLSVPAFAAGSTKEEVQQTLSELQSQKAALESRLADLQANKADTESYIAQLDTELTAVYEEIQRISSELDQTEADLAQTQDDLQVAKDKEAQQYEALKARIRAMYEAGDTSMMEIFMQAEDIATILNATEYISRISDYDNALLEALNETRLQIEDLEAQLEQQKAELENLKTQQESKQEELQIVMDAKQAELGDIEGSIGDAYDGIYSTEAEIAENKQILADIEYQEELQRQAELKRQQEEAARKKAEEEALKQQQAAASQNNSQNSSTSASGSSSSSGSTSTSTSTGSSSTGSTGSSSTGSSSSAGTATGGFIWPCAGGYISSGFGGRVSPTAGASSNHQGIDIAAGSGTAIYAADGGVVTTVSYSAARGNYVVVSHGNGLSTLYQHCSSVSASVGQSVSQGDVIAYVGSTGYSTGPHLHFEVWVNGTPVNPASYI